MSACRAYRTGHRPVSGIWSGAWGEATAGYNAMKRILLALLGLLIVYQVAGRTWDAIAFRYFRHQCKVHGGEFIYRTVDNVEGVFQMRLRDPRDYFDRLRKGDIPEDPYGHTNWEAQEPQTMFVEHPFRNYKYFENPLPANVMPKAPGAKFRRYSGLTYVRGDYKPAKPMVEEHVSELKSRYGFTWRENQSFWDKCFGVRASELSVLELGSREVLARRVGYFLRRPFGKEMSICPKGKDDDFTYELVKKVLKPPAHQEH